MKEIADCGLRIAERTKEEEYPHCQLWNCRFKHILSTRNPDNPVPLFIPHSAFRNPQSAIRSLLHSAFRNSALTP
jgi:hypothetical protein